MIGSEFRQVVWRILLQIPYGEVTTYGAVAEEVAKTLNVPEMSAQAVGGAVGHNAISIRCAARVENEVWSDLGLFMGCSRG